MIRNGVTYKFITDHLGSIRLIVDVATGMVVQKLEYDEFGDVVSDSKPDFQPFAYAGGLYETRTKLVRFGFRDYESNSGRWTSKDPIGFEGGVSNLFEYVINDPVNKFDRNGKQSLPSIVVRTVVQLFTKKQKCGKGDVLHTPKEIADAWNAYLHPELKPNLDGHPPPSFPDFQPPSAVPDATAAPKGNLPPSGLPPH